VSDVTVVIGNYNGEELLRDCIVSARRQSLEPAAILVVDGGSTDRSASVANQLGVKFVARENRGLGYLYNRGVADAATEYVFLANNDIALTPGCLEALAVTLEAHPDTFAVDARQLDWSGSRTIHGRTTLTRGALVREHLPGLHLDHNGAASDVVPTVCANGAAMMVRRTMFCELGGFDETFFMDWEDLDLCWRAWLRRWRTLYVPRAIVRHRVGAVTTEALRPRRAASSHHNLARFAVKCLPWSAAARVLAGEMLRLPAHPRAISIGLGRLFFELPAVARERAALGPKQPTYDALTGSLR
jgi:GT2 family glycosyltransferase